VLTSIIINPLKSKTILIYF